MPTLCASALLATGCATRTVGDYCDLARPIYAEPQDVEFASDALLRQVLQHNEKWRDRCGERW